MRIACKYMEDSFTVTVGKYCVMSFVNVWSNLRVPVWNKKRLHFECNRGTG